MFRRRRTDAIAKAVTEALARGLFNPVQLGQAVRATVADASDAEIGAALESVQTNIGGAMTDAAADIERLERWLSSRSVDRDHRTALERAAEGGDAEAQTILNSRALGLLEALGLPKREGSTHG